ncbi:MAG: hypothetical protein Q8928_11945 [Bacteroidota bacterium]|nr:hypothetical protein [Bacteroidota bacterium]
MIKKVFHIIIALIMILGTAGISLTRHYCGGLLVSTTIYDSDHSCCGEHCKKCHNELISIKISDSFTEPSSSESALFTVCKLLNQPYYIDLYQHSTIQSQATDPFSIPGKPPPLVTSVQIAKLQVFRC